MDKPPGPSISITGDFLEDLDEFICARLERINPEELPAYIQANKESIKLREQMKASFSEELRDALEALLKLHTQMETEVQEQAYRRGLSDGVKLILQNLLS